MIEDCWVPYTHHNSGSVACRIWTVRRPSPKSASSENAPRVRSTCLEPFAHPAHESTTRAVSAWVRKPCRTKACRVDRAESGCRSACPRCPGPRPWGPRRGQRAGSGRVIGLWDGRVVSNAEMASTCRNVSPMSSSPSIRRQRV